MFKQNLARDKLEKARFFINRASRATPAKRKIFINFIEGAIVFARSVTLCLQ